MSPLALCLAAAPLVVPPGGGGWNAFQVLGLGADTAAVREVRLSEAAGGETQVPLCMNPGLAAVLLGRSGTEALSGSATGTEGVTLHAWRLPAPGSSSLVAKDEREEIYASGPADAGCTSEVQAKAALQRMKGFYSDAGVSIATAPAHVDLLSEAFREEPKCFQAKGCTVMRSAPLGDGTVELELTLQAKSPCGDDIENGCRVERRYRGTVKHRGKSAAFDLVTRPSGSSRQVMLTGAAAVAAGHETLALLYVSWCYISCREKVPVLLRLK